MSFREPKYSSNRFVSSDSGYVLKKNMIKPPYRSGFYLNIKTAKYILMTFAQNKIEEYANLHHTAYFLVTQAKSS